MEFKARVNGESVTVNAKVERIKNDQGGYDVIVHAPSLELINLIER